MQLVHIALNLFPRKVPLRQMQERKAAIPLLEGLCNGLEVFLIASCHKTYFPLFRLNLNANLVCNMINLAF